MPKLENWNGMFESSPKKIFTPNDEGQIRHILSLHGNPGRKIRVVGPARHTWGELSMSNDVVINMKRFNKIISHTIDHSKPNSTLTVQGGVIIEDLLKFCVAHGVMIKNMGAIDKQTIAGVFSTGTHGSTTESNPNTFSDQVTSVKIMLADGTVRTFEKSDQIEWRALMCSLGYFGIVLELSLEVIPIYDIHEVNQRYSLNDLDTREKFNEWLENLMTSNHYLELIYFPTNNDVIVRKRVRTAHNNSIGMKIKNWWNPISDHLTGYVREFFTKVGNLFPSSIPTLLSIANKQIVKTISEKTLRADVLFINNTFCHYNTTTVIDQEFSAPYSDAFDVFNLSKKVVDEIFQKNRGIVFSFRFDPGNDSLIGTSSGRKTIFVEFQHMTNDMSIESIITYKKIEQIANNNGWRPHWGKYNNLNKQLLDKLYPQENIKEFNCVKKYFDPNNIFGNKYLDDIFGASK